MAKYMVTWQLPHESRNEAIKRFSVDSIRPPKGVKTLGQWHKASFGGGYSVVETNDPKLITEWVIRFSDIVPYEVAPVITDEEIGELIKKHGLKS
jgi:hypothetical protein